MTFGEKVKKARNEHNLSQVELAEKVGKSRRTVIDGRMTKRSRAQEMYMRILHRYWRFPSPIF